MLKYFIILSPSIYSPWALYPRPLFTLALMGLWGSIFPKKLSEQDAPGLSHTHCHGNCFMNHSWVWQDWAIHPMTQLNPGTDPGDSIVCELLDELPWYENLGRLWYTILDRDWSASQLLSLERRWTPQSDFRITRVPIITWIVIKNVSGLHKPWLLAAEIAFCAF